MYQPYPSGGQPPEQARPQPPGAVRTATLFMYAGAVFSLTGLIVSILTIGAYRTAIHHSFPRYTGTQVHSLASALVTFNVVVDVIEIFLWLLLARACRAGRNWARITGSTLFVLNTGLLLFAFARTRLNLGIVLSLLIWLAGLGAVIMLWRRESSSYFTPPAGS
jgi:hypothetical protein